MSDPGKDSNYGSITDPILPPASESNMQETELDDMPNTSQNTDPLQCEDVEVNKLPEEMELNKVYEHIG